MTIIGGKTMLDDDFIGETAQELFIHSACHQCWPFAQCCQKHFILAAKIRGLGLKTQTAKLRDLRSTLQLFQVVERGK